MHKSKNNYRLRGKKSLSAVSLLSVTALCAFALTHSSLMRAQSQSQATATTAPVLEYEAATIKPDNSDVAPAALTADDGINMRNVPLNIIMGVAFGVSNDRIIGAPEWLSDRYDINAKMDADVADALKKLNPLDRRTARQHMLQTVLIDHCKITFHRETRELSAYMLVVAKGGPKLKEGKPADASPEGVGGTGTMQFGQGGLMTFQAMPLSALIQIISQQVGRTVIDKTGLNGRYDFTWQFNQNANPGAGRSGGGPPAGAGSASSFDSEPPSIFTVLQEELGLKLESGKGPVEVIVLDHIEKPSDN